MTGPMVRAELKALQAREAELRAVPSRAAQRLPHLAVRDMVTLDRELRDALAKVSE
jgi:phage terminase Nu1 subunit (DNA packaging protein)